ncbi:nitrogenase component 1 [Schwartzia sp. (in: firmicutes)]
MRDWHVHVFTSTYTADVSGVCSVMYELGGMTILHDPDGCNSTYTTHDEPRWYGSKALMFASGIDELTAVLGDDNVLIDDVCAAAEDYKPRFITLCGASIPHIIAFDFKGVAHIIEKKTGIPVLPVPTNGLRMYTGGVGLALREWFRRFADFSLRSESKTINLLGVTPIDFSRQEIVDSMKAAFEKRGFKVQAVGAMGESFEGLQEVCRASVNVVVSSAGRLPARFLQEKAGIPFVEGTPVGSGMTDKIAEAVLQSENDKKNRKVFERGLFLPGEEAGIKKNDLLVVGEEVYAFSMAQAAADVLGQNAEIRVIYPDVEEGIDEEALVDAINSSEAVLCDPLYRNAFRQSTARLIPMPHEGYSGRIFRKDIPVFTGDDFDNAGFLKQS